MNENDKPTVPMPSDEFVRHLSRLTDANDHGRVYIETAEWCREHYPRDNRDWKDVTSAFSMFCSMFKAMDKHHKTLGNFPFGDLRYAVGKAMDKVIIDRFGRRVMDKLDEGGRS